MSDDWEPGDLALCIRTGAPMHPTGFRRDDASAFLTRGSIYTVRATETVPPAFLDAGETLLYLTEVVHPLGRGFASTRFRKIRPHTADEEDRETIRLLTGGPVTEPAA